MVVGAGEAEGRLTQYLAVQCARITDGRCRPGLVPQVSGSLEGVLGPNRNAARAAEVFVSSNSAAKMRWCTPRLYCCFPSLPAPVKVSVPLW